MQSDIVINNREKAGMELIEVEFINEMWDDGNYIRIWDIHHGRKATGITKIDRSGAVRYTYHGVVYTKIEDAVKAYEKHGPYTSRASRL